MTDFPTIIITKVHKLALFKGTTHLDPLLSAGFGAEVPVFIFLIFFSF